MFGKVWSNHNVFTQGSAPCFRRSSTATGLFFSIATYSGVRPLLSEISITPRSVANGSKIDRMGSVSSTVCDWDWPKNWPWITKVQKTTSRGHIYNTYMILFHRILGGGITYCPLWFLYSIFAEISISQSPCTASMAVYLHVVRAVQAGLTANGHESRSIEYKSSPHLDWPITQLTR